MKMIESVTKTVKALPVHQERGQMPPARVAQQKRTTLVAVAAWAVGAGLLHFLPDLPVWLGGGIIVYGFFAFDARLFGDFFKYILQFISALRGGAPAEAPRGD